MKLEQNETSHKTAALRVSKRNAYHQAGKVVSIHLGNQRKCLPAVHFQIAVKPAKSERGGARQFTRITAKHTVKLEGGRLIESLPNSYEAATKRLSSAQRKQCQEAFEADVVNLLAGSLAEAKYVALRDGEIFNANLVYLGALKFYGGGMDLELIDNYMTCMLPEDSQLQQSRLAELFLQAYGFINDKHNWTAIAKLAETIVSAPKELFTCEELIHIIDKIYPASFEISPKPYIHSTAPLTA